jgi:opacity protein-like surface antigen
MSRNLIAVVAVAFSGAGQALAQDSEEQQGIYIGVGIGDAATEINQLSVDENETAYKLFVGYRFNQFLALQGDFLDLGRTDSTFGVQNLAVETRGFTARIEGTLPLAFLELFATAGYIFSDVKATLGGSQIFDESDSDLVYSAGAGIEVFERLVLRLEYEIIEIEALDDSKALWITAGWRF